MPAASPHSSVDRQPPVGTDPASAGARPVVGAGPAVGGSVFQALDRCAAWPYTRREYVGRQMWLWVQMTLFRWSPRRAFRWRAAILRRFGARVGPNLAVRRTCRFVHPWLFEAEEWVSLGDGVDVYNLGPVRIGRHTTVSQRVHLCAGTHDYTRPELPLVRRPITIGRGVWVAAEAFVGPGVTVGDNSVVGARAVVARDVPPGVVVAGNPARVIKPRAMPADDAVPS